MSTIDSVTSLVQGIREQNRRALAKSITLVESTRADHRERAMAVMQALASDGRAASSIRIGISGAPGVGKSTFIEVLGMLAIANGRRVAVLSVDPSSRISGGSILGDKTRMPQLAQAREAYIRPSAAGHTLGGVARRTRETLALCEAAGFDLILVETVGVGQSETNVANMTDMFVLLLLPMAGDELQGIKRGIMELADLVLVNKADGEQRPLAEATVADYRNAMRLMRPRSDVWQPTVQMCSALAKEGIENVWTAILNHDDALRSSGELARRRADQASAWLWEELAEQLMYRLSHDQSLAARIAALENDVMNDRMAAPVAAAEILDLYLNNAERTP
jgi:LAO/AO transport system kinase